MTRGLCFTKAPNFSLRCHAYADWANDPLDKQFTSGFCLYLGPNLISWSCKKQSTVSRSSTKAGYLSIAVSIAELMWVQSLLRELHIQLPAKPVLYSVIILVQYSCLTIRYFMRALNIWRLTSSLFVKKS